VGLGYRIFVVAPNLSGVSPSAPLVYINPKITKRSKQTKNMEEGCLSVRWLYGEVKRHTQISITAYDEKGVQFKRDASGLLAHIYQHEIEHLDGVLFIDKAKYVTRLDDEAIAKMESENTQ
jgi:peptide deformylase